MNECLQVPYVFIKRRTFDFLASLEYEPINSVLRNLFRVTSPSQSFEVMQREGYFIK